MIRLITRLRVSYRDDAELRGLMKALPEPVGRIKRQDKGDHRLAYIDIKSEDLCALSVTENKRKPA